MIRCMELTWATKRTRFSVVRGLGGGGLKKKEKKLRKKYWSGLPFPPPGDLPHPRMEPASPALQAGSLPAEQSAKYLC